jgi:hypothetical protein
MSKAMKYGFELNDAKVSNFRWVALFPPGRSFFSGTGYYPFIHNVLAKNSHRQLSGKHEKLEFI